ncbi:MAG: POTRA domain-containing protein, partial [Myxococcota bacterium]
MLVAACLCLAPLATLAVPARALADEAAVDRLPEGPVAAIEVEGNRRVGSEAVERRMATRPGSPLSWEDIREDVRRLYELGYFDDVSVHLRESPDGPVVVVRVEEKPAVRQVVFEGNSAIKEDELEEMVGISAYSLLDTTRVERAVREIETSYRGKGYFLAEVETRLDAVP